jgi:hypothetical protein
MIHNLFSPFGYWFLTPVLSFNSSLSELPRSYRGRDTNPDEHLK